MLSWGRGMKSRFRCATISCFCSARRIVIPLRQHVVDAVESDHGFHIDRDGGIGIVAVCRGKAAGRERQQRREMPSG